MRLMKSLMMMNWMKNWKMKKRMDHSGTQVMIGFLDARVVGPVSTNDNGNGIANKNERILQVSPCRFTRLNRVHPPAP